jgi:hypothetical protein
MAKIEIFKVPAKLGACADLLYTTQQKRYEVQKLVDELKAQETQLKDKIINELPKSEASGVTGKLARVTVVCKEQPRIDDQDKLFAFVKKTNRFDLLQKRLSDAAIRDMWDEGKEIPGVSKFNTVGVSINKI